MLAIFQTMFSHRRGIVLRSIVAISLAIALFLSGCSFSEKKDLPVAAYGNYGQDLAIAFAEGHPYRKAYSEQEKAAGQFIKTEFEKLGYSVEEQVFTGSGGNSTNYIVRIPGEGFVSTDAATKQNTPLRRTAIVGAHYDTRLGIENQPDNPDYNGIQENASGIAVLFTVAKEMKDLKMGYDVILVAFGAGNDNFAGATAFRDSLSQEELSKVDVMYNIESIYAGDTLYANSGLNSLVPGQKYEMRRKLYEAYDVVYENELSSKNGVDLLYNECGTIGDYNGDGVEDVYREFTITKSDYVPFDEAGIPIVFFESYNYNYPTVEEMKETKNLRLQANGGLIRNTNNDSTRILGEVFDADLLSKRINNIAFIIIGAIKKGAHDLVSKSDFEAGLTLTPQATVSVSETKTSEITAGT